MPLRLPFQRRHILAIAFLAFVPGVQAEPEYETPCQGCNTCTWILEQYFDYCKCTIRESHSTVEIDYDNAIFIDTESACVLTCDLCDESDNPHGHDSCKFRAETKSVFPTSLECGTIESGLWQLGADGTWRRTRRQEIPFSLRIHCQLGQRRLAMVSRCVAPATLTASFVMEATCTRGQGPGHLGLHGDGLDSNPLIEHGVFLAADPNEDEGKKDIPFGTTPAEPKITRKYRCGTATMDIDGVAITYTMRESDEELTCK